MGKIVVTEFISLDGVVEDPGGVEGFEHGGWTFAIDRGPEGDRVKLEELEQAEAQLFGRRTYEGFAEVWPGREGDPAMGAYAARINALPKYVYSSALTEPSWRGTTVLSGDFAEAIGTLRDEVAGNILVVGSISLVQGLVEHDLLDELRLMVFPVILGSGKRLFGSGAKRPLRLTDAKTVGAGVQVVTYARA